jgi:serine/threonine protein kinase
LAVRISNEVSEKIYYAPELMSANYRTPLNGEKIDVFALGVIFFVALFGDAPFQVASPADPYYRLFCKDRQEFERFFKVHRALRKQ